MAESDELTQKPEELSLPEVIDLGFKKKADDLYTKFGLTEAIPNKDQVVEKAYSMLQEYQVPEDFCDDEVNLGLVLGCAEKLVEHKTGSYKDRVNNLFLRLIEPVVGKRINSDNLWGKEPDMGGLEDDKLEEYVIAHRDARASADFEVAHADKFERCKEVWRDKGYNLEIQVNIVSSSRWDFKKDTGYKGYINPPERDDVERTKSGTLEIVLTKDDAEELEFLIRHEIYHIEDYFEYKRRGYQSGILEGIDELHTEFAVGNFKAGKDDPEVTKATYLNLKEFWRKLSLVSGLEFDLLLDRDKLIENICSEFGFTGLVDFSLMNAHNSGKAKVFETFYGEPNSPLLNMLIDREKIRLRKSSINGVVAGLNANDVREVTALGKSIKPEGNIFNTYKNLEMMIPDGERNVNSNSKDDEVNYSRRVENAEAAERIIAFSRGLAHFEIFANGETSDSELIQQMLEAVTQVPIALNRSIPEGKSKLEESLIYKLENYKKPKDEIIQDSVHSWLVGLSSDLGDISFVFSLDNSGVRNQLLSLINIEMNKITRFVLDQDGGSGVLVDQFVRGIYGYNLPFDLRDYAAAYLIESYPELASRITDARSKFDSRRHKTTSL